LRLQIDHYDAQKAYVFWKHEILKSLVLTPPTFQLKNKSWRFRTISHSELTEIGKLFYRNRQKIVPQEIISLLEPISLAVWFMDDGSRHGGGGYLINTQGFTYDECKILKNALNEKFNLDTTLHKDHNGWRLYIRVSSAEKFRQIVKSFLSNIFMYKL